MTANASFGESGHGDGQVYSIGSTVAVNSDRANVMVGINWDHRDAIPGSARSWATDPHVGAVSGEGGSSYRSQLNVLQDENSTNVWFNNQLHDYTDSTINWPGVDPALVYLTGAGRAKMDANRVGWNDLTGGQDRKQISFSTHYDLTPDFRFIAEGFYSDRNSTQALRPEPLLGDTISNGVFPGFIIPADQVAAMAPAGTPPGAITAYLTPNQFGPRAYHQDVVHAGKIWVFGGGNYVPEYQALNDVWCSADGVQWTQVIATAPWSPRLWFSAVTYRDRMWILGGWSNNPSKNWGDVWYSKDGKAWQQLRSNVCWKERHEHSAFVFQDKIWIAGGHAQPLSSEVWSLAVPKDWFKNE